MNYRAGVLGLGFARTGNPLTSVFVVELAPIFLGSTLEYFIRSC